MKSFGLIRRIVMIKKIKDERLRVQSLKNIRVAFIVQTLGIVAILLYIGITEGTRELVSHPVWFVFMITMTIFLWLNIRISLDVYDHANESKKPGPYYRIIIISLLVGLAIGLFARFGPDQTKNSEAVITGSIVFISFLISYSIGYFLVKKRSEDNDV